MSDKAALDSLTRSDAGILFETELKIWPKDRAGGLVSPTQNYYQKLIQKVVNKMRALDLPVRILGLKPRQKGSTTYFGALDYQLLRESSISGCVIGGEYKQTVSLWEIITTYQANDRFESWGNSGTINNDNGKWSHGSTLTKETARDELAGVSFTFQLLHATEVARWAKYGVRNDGAVLTNILKCVPLAPRTYVFLESTAEGAAGEFYNRWLRGIDAEDFLSGRVVPKPGDYIRVFAPWFVFDDSVLRLTQDEKDEIARTIDADPAYDGERLLVETYGHTREDGTVTLGKSVTMHDVYEQLAWRRYAIREECKGDLNIFNRDYPHSWKDAFQKSGNLRFNIHGLKALRAGMNARAALDGVLEEGPQGMVFRQTDRQESKFRVFERPTAGRRYVLSLDPMTGASQTSGKDPDYHGGNVIRDGFWDGTNKWNRPAQVAKIVPSRWDIDVAGMEGWRLARYYGGSSGCKIIIEMNQDRGLAEFLKEKQADLYMREVFNQLEFKTTKQIGYMTMPRTRERAIECLATALREYDKPGEGIDIFDEYTIEQLENFVIKANGRSEAAEGYHDDEILSIALGLLLKDHGTTYFPHRMGEGLPPDLAGLIRPTGAGGPSAYS